MGDNAGCPVTIFALFWRRFGVEHVVVYVRVASLFAQAELKQQQKRRGLRMASWTTAALHNTTRTVHSVRELHPGAPTEVLLLSDCVAGDTLAAMDRLPLCRPTVVGASLRGGLFVLCRKLRSDRLMPDNHVG